MASQDDNLLETLILPIWEEVELDVLITVEQLPRQAHEVLKRRPTLVKVKSRFSATETTVTHETETKYQDTLD